MNPKTDPEPRDTARHKPRFSLLIATVFGLGYLPKAPGTWGSLAGAAFAISLNWFTFRRLAAVQIERDLHFWTTGLLPPYADLLVVILLSLLGVFVASRVSRFVAKKDPQFVVIDEFCGQILTFSLPFTVLNWKSWLLGFILFRVFDIWKPFPARQAEHLPGGWGIMADDWVAAVYAALGLWLARAFGL